MASKAKTSAGTRLYVGVLPVSYTVAAFAAVSWIEVAEVTNAGEFGKTYNLVTHNPLATRQTVKRRGSFNNGALALQMARTPTDAGQAFLVTALDSDDSIAVKVGYKDGEVAYMSAQVMSYTSNIGSVDQITAAAVALEIDDEVLSVPAP